jgi:hypothetical protein
MMLKVQPRQHGSLGASCHHGEPDRDARDWWPFRLEWDWDAMHWSGKCSVCRRQFVVSETVTASVTIEENVP